MCATQAERVIQLTYNSRHAVMIHPLWYSSHLLNSKSQIIRKQIQKRFLNLSFARCFVGSGFRWWNWIWRSLTCKISKWQILIFFNSFCTAIWLWLWVTFDLNSGWCDTKFLHRRCCRIVRRHWRARWPSDALISWVISSYDHIKKHPVYSILRYHNSTLNSISEFTWPSTDSEIGQGCWALGRTPAIKPCEAIILAPETVVNFELIHWILAFHGISWGIKGRHFFIRGVVFSHDLTFQAVWSLSGRHLKSNVNIEPAPFPALFFSGGSLNSQNFSFLEIKSLKVQNRWLPANVSASWAVWWQRLWEFQAKIGKVRHVRLLRPSTEVACGTQDGFIVPVTLCPHFFEATSSCLWIHILKDLWSIHLRKKEIHVSGLFTARNANCHVWQAVLGADLPLEALPSPGQVTKSIPLTLDTLMAFWVGGLSAFTSCRVDFKIM